MSVVGTAESVVVGRSARDDQIVAFKEPVYVLKRVLLDVGMVEHDRVDRPVLQVGTTDQRERVSR